MSNTTLKERVTKLELDYYEIGNRVKELQVEMESLKFEKKKEELRTKERERNAKPKMTSRLR